MKLYLISQEENDDYDTYSDAVVCASDDTTARHLHPHNGEPIVKWEDKYPFWCSSPDKVTVKYLGEADPSVPPGIVCHSYHAG